MSFDRLIEKIVKTQNPTVAGLDPKLEYVPEYLQQRAFATHGKTLAGAAAAILEYNKGLIDSLCDIVPAIKPQCAYYEMYGWQGVKTLAETIEYAKERGMFVITDGKRNDIGSTMGAYSAAHLGLTDITGEKVEAFGGDSLTVNGYLGEDGIKPLYENMAARDKGIFVLVKTSNPSSGELQDKLLEGKPLFEVMGELCEKWGENDRGKYGYSGVGAVVGATYPQQLKTLREQCPHTFFLVPGYGAQGGGAKDVIGAFDERGLGAIVNSSRGIICAYRKKEGYTPEEFGRAAREEAIRMRDDIMKNIGEITL